MSAVSADPASALTGSGSRASHDGVAQVTTGLTEAGDQQKRQRRPVKKPARICRYFQTPSGCRAGDSCQFRHIVKSTNREQGTTDPTDATPASASSEPQTVQVVEAGQQSSTTTPIQARPARPAVSKPVPTAQRVNPREFQLSQVVRRFAPKREDEADGSTTLVFNLSPSDPDFPFELEALQCELKVPPEWPSPSSRPSIRIQNNEIPKGFQINIEKGFDSLVVNNKTLLALLNDLDRHLERFLSTEKAQTIKIVANRGKHEQVPPSAAPQPTSVSTPTKAISTALESAPAPLATPSWSSQQKVEAKAKREADIRQLQARMGRLPLFSAAPDGTTFNIPITYAKRGRLPLALKALKEMTLRVPRLYNLEPCTIQLKGVSGAEVVSVEASFAQYSREHGDSTLMAHINYLTQHLPEMATLDRPTTAPVPAASAAPVAAEPTEPAGVDTVEGDEQPDGEVDQDRPHLIFLSRPPPEWSRKERQHEKVSDSEESSDYESEEYTASSADEDQGGAAVQASATTSTAEKGILFSLPQIEMTGIELLEVYSLSISVKCDRCKQSSEIRNIRPSGSSTSMASTNIIRTESCNKCASLLSASYRAEPIHANSIKAGHLDLGGCTVLDMLPSTFQPTCSECSTPAPVPPGLIAVRADTVLSVCTTCHKKHTLTIPDVKFLRVSSSDPRIHSALPPRRKKKENLGITTGTPLPDRGRCKHYAKSYRWFRFSCCQRVYPCDRCHDESESHPNEHANRMICGWCSREQNYRPDDCGACQRSVIRRVGGGFWEGGKGTRDKVRMSRKDPRKFKRIGGTAAGGTK